MTGIGYITYMIWENKKWAIYFRQYSKDSKIDIYLYDKTIKFYIGYYNKSGFNKAYITRFFKGDIKVPKQIIKKMEHYWKIRKIL